jgi:hypothetical protein
MKIQNYSKVILNTDKYSLEGIRKGSIGYVIEVYDNNYEVEFSDADGTTITQLVLQESDFSTDCF